MKIDLATKSDIEGILALQPQIYRVEKLSENAADILNGLIESDTCDVLVAKEDDTVLGSAFIFYLPNPAHGTSYAYLEGLVVDEAKRGHGIGTALFEECQKIAKQKGAYKILFTSGMDRQDAHKFYEKLGFKKWGFEFRKNLD